MLVTSPRFEFEVGSNEAVALEQLAGWTLTAANGQVWLTEENDSRDYCLEPGERHRIRGAGKVVLVSWPTAESSAAQPLIIRLAPPLASLGRMSLRPRQTVRRPALAWC